MMNSLWLLCLLSIIYICQMDSSPVMVNPFVRQQTVSYGQHPYNNKHRHRELLNSQEMQDAMDETWSNIRITPYFDYLDENTESETAAVLKHAISAAIRYYEQFVKVIHTDKALRLSKSCTYDENDSKNCTTTCGDTNFVIPSEHLDTGWIVDNRLNESGQCQVMDVDAPGLGIADTDLVVYVSNQNYRCAGRSWQMVCEQDQFGRPIAILLNFCGVSYRENELSSNFEEVIDLTMHELTHGLILNSDYFGKFRNAMNGNAVQENEVLSHRNGSMWIISGEVQRIARQHFDCELLFGAMLDSTDSHWDARMLNTELMSNSGYYMYLSKFTIALMKDSGWYRIDDYSFAEPFYFGFKRGCSFIFADCVSKQYRLSNYPLFWCDSYDDIGCFYDYSQTSTKCLYSERIDQTTEHIPYKYQYFGYSSIGGPQQTHYCPFLSPHHGTKCINEQTDTSHLDNTFVQTFGHRNSRCVQTNSGPNKLTAACFDVFCMSWNAEMHGYDHVIITINDGLYINSNVSCYRNDEGATVNVVCPIGMECLSITCPYIDTLCGFSQQPFQCYHGHYDDASLSCICNPGYKGQTCLDHDLGFETLQLFSSFDAILITYYNTFCIYGLQWGDAQIVENMNGVWKIQGMAGNASQSRQYNPVYISQNNAAFIIYYSACDESWFIKDTANQTIIAKCYHDRFDWTDYGALISCTSFWYIDHHSNGAFLRDVNVLMSDGDETEQCNALQANVEPFADYEYICVDLAQHRDGYFVSGTYIKTATISNGYHSWSKMEHGSNDERYLSFGGASWRLAPHYICYTFDNDPISCNNQWFTGNEFDNVYPIGIEANQCDGDTFPTAPTAPSTPTLTPSAAPTAAPIIAAQVINAAVCLRHAGGSFDGTYIANGTLNGKQMFLKSYLPQLHRPFIYLYYNAAKANGSWIVYRDIDSNNGQNLWFLHCVMAPNILDVTNCSGHWVTSWSGNEAVISLTKGVCDTDSDTNNNPTPKPSNHPITANQVNKNYICVQRTGFADLDGTYSLNGTFNQHNSYKKAYQPQQNKPWVYIKFEDDSNQNEYWDENGPFGWIIYRKFHTQNFYFYCNASWAKTYYSRLSEMSQDPTQCNGHWITNWFNDDDTVDISLQFGLCADDIIIPQSNAPSIAPIISPPISTKYCGSQPVNANATQLAYFYDFICLSHVADPSLAGIYKLNGSYHGYPAYIKSYFPSQQKPFVYVKYEEVVMGDIDGDGTVDTRKQWIVYRSYCAQSYYLYCEHSRTSRDIQQCNGYWHTSWSGKEVHITATHNITSCAVDVEAAVSAPNAICISNSSELANGRYLKMEAMHNGHAYYRKEEGVMFIKYEEQWMVSNDLENNLTYYLECDASVDSVDVSECNGKWKGMDVGNKVASVDCPHDVFNSTMTREVGVDGRGRRQVVAACVIIAFLFLICIIGFIVSKQKGKRHRFDRLQDDDAEDSEVGGDADGLDIDIGITNNDENGIGGGTKESKTRIKTNVSHKLAKVFKRKNDVNMNDMNNISVCDESENVELVSSSNSNTNNSHSRSHSYNYDEEEEEEEDEEEDVDEFTSELADDDYEYDVDDENDDNQLLNKNGNSISYVSPHNRLEID